MSLLKIKLKNKSYLCKYKPPYPKGLVYLTYFEDVKDTDITINPKSIIGPAGTYRDTNGMSGASTSNIPDGVYQGVPSLAFSNLSSLFSSLYDDNYNPCTLLDSLFKSNVSISIETTLYIGSFDNQLNPWQGIGISFITGKYFTLGINTYTYERGIMIGFPSWNTPIASSGFHYYYPDGNNAVSFSSDDYRERVKTGLHHLAIVIDRNKNQLRGYIDGILVGTMNTTIVDQIYKVGLYNNLNRSILTTQFAIFAEDRSTNDGNSYPVPQKPYVKF